MRALIPAKQRLVSDIKANSAWIKDGVNGFLHKLGDAGNLADCILRFLDEPEICENAGPYNRNKVEQKADKNKNMKRLETIYRELIQKAR